MKKIRNSDFVRGLFWLIVFVSQINIALSSFENSRREFVSKQEQANNYYFIAASDVSIWAERTKNDRNFSLQLLICFLLTTSLVFSNRVIPSFKHVSVIFSRIVKVFTLSPTYIIHRVLLI